MTKKIKFTATPRMKYYHGVPYDWKDGDIREIEEAEALRLTAQFPYAFICVSDKPVPKPQSPEEKSESVNDKGDKIVHPVKNKSLSEKKDR